MITARATTIIAAGLSLLAAPARAQSVADVLAFLVTNQSVTTGSTERDRAAAQSASDAISRALLASLATLPVSTSSGAFVFRLNRSLGTVERATDSLGPFLVERAHTAGRHGGSLALTFQQLRFTSLDGRRLQDGSLVTTANQFVGDAEPFDADRLALKVVAEITTLHASVGLTDRLELGAAVPMVALHVSGSRVDTYRGVEFTQAAASATAIGVADAVLRAKYQLFGGRTAAFAAAVDARLPTGRKSNLLGTGALSIRTIGIGSIEAGRLAFHGNAGVTAGGLGREVTYGGATTISAGPRVSFGTELVGRWIPRASRTGFVTGPHPTLSDVETIRLASTESGLHLLTVAPGVKWNVGNTWMLVANVSTSLTQDGLRASPTPYIGLEYAFAR
jgi:hypothetical protein